MYQESDDKLKGSVKSDTLLFVLLIVFFFFAGTIATVLRAKFDSNAPLYVFALLLAALLILVYKLRIEGYRYTVFYAEPETEYDARFDEYITHEDHPFPVGTIVIERTASAKGEILEVIRKEELVALLDPGAGYAADKELVYAPRKKEKCSSVIFSRDDQTTRLYFTPTEKFKEYVRSFIEA
ncbi:MAG: hypothetical protein K6G56_06655 [Clostridiales bacterium]|nr:hypothetical protein [Clostridiales bacterium]